VLITGCDTGFGNAVAKKLHGLVMRLENRHLSLLFNSEIGEIASFRGWSI
jgi:hypothetical protein